jgi:hypothetical protein
MEALLARRGTVDLRSRGLGAAHVAQLLAAGAKVLVAVADVPRRRAALEGLGLPGRLAGDHVHVLVAGDRSDRGGLRGALARAAEAAGSGTRLLVVADHATLDVVLAAGLPLDATVVLDPPATRAARDVLADPERGGALHLVFGAREQRFAADALRAALDVRATLADAWRHLRDGGGAIDAQLGPVLWGTGTHPRSATAVLHGLRTLVGRGLLEVDGDGLLRIAAERRAPASSVSG